MSWNWQEPGRALRITLQQERDGEWAAVRDKDDPNTWRQWSATGSMPGEETMTTEQLVKALAASVT